VGDVAKKLYTVQITIILMTKLDGWKADILILRGAPIITTETVKFHLAQS
jgi:hypothetical protein